MKKIVSLAALLIVQVFFVGLLDLSAQSKEVAVTIDDLPLNGQQFDAKRLRTMTDKFLAGLKKFHIPRSASSTNLCCISRAKRTRESGF